MTIPRKGLKTLADGCDIVISHILKEEVKQKMQLIWEYLGNWGDL